MLDYREHMRNYEERAQKIAREQERLRTWTNPPQPSALRQTIAQVGKVLVTVGTRLQTVEPHTRQRLV
jgi:hypothetical protein